MLDNQNLIIYSEVQTEFTDKAYIHAVVNEAMVEDPKSGKKEAVRGFDKLESSGFNVDDIHNLRFHFHAMCIYTGLNKEEEEEKFKLEEDWLDGKLPQINSNLRDRCEILLGIVWDRQDAQLGDGVDFVWGLMLGIIFSFFVLIFVWEIQKKKFVMNKRQNYGVLLGIPLSLLWIVIILKLCEVF